MKLTGVEVSVDTVKNVQPNTVLVVFTDKSSGDIKVIQVDSNSIPKGESFVQITGQGGCWVCVNGAFVWCDPCP